MGLFRSVAAFGIAKRLFTEARKPHNQARIRSGVDSVRSRGRGRGATKKR